MLCSATRLCCALHAALVRQQLLQLSRNASKSSSGSPRDVRSRRRQGRGELDAEDQREMPRSELEWYGAAAKFRQPVHRRGATDGVAGRQEGDASVWRELRNDPTYLEHLFDVENDVTELQSKLEGRQQLLDDDRHQRQYVKRKILAKKYDAHRLPPETNLLTWEAKCQVRHLAQTAPEEWTPHALAQAFPLSEAAAKRLLADSRLCWRVPRSPEWIQRHDRDVQQQWQRLRELGKLGKNPSQLRPGFEWLFQENKLGLLRNAAGIPSLPRPERNLMEQYLAVVEERRRRPVGPFEALLGPRRPPATTTAADGSEEASEGAALAHFLAEYESSLEANRQQLQRLNHEEVLRDYQKLLGAAQVPQESPEPDPSATLLDMARQRRRQAERQADAGGATTAEWQRQPERQPDAGGSAAVERPSGSDFTALLDKLESEEDVRWERWYRSRTGADGGRRRHRRRPAVASRLRLDFAGKFEYELDAPPSSS